MPKRLRTGLSWIIYPGLLAAAVVGAHYAIAGGWNEALVVSGASLVTGAVIFALQFLMPHSDAWALDPDDLKVDLVHAVVSMGGTTAVFKSVFFGGLFLAADRMAALIGGSLWPHHWPLALQFALALLAGELGSYWTHRLSHEKGWLWPIHALHHSPEKLYLLSSGRNHPISVFLSYGLQMSILILLGARGEVLALHAVFTGVHGLLQHANVEMRIPHALNFVFSTPVLHRWHHSRQIAESDHNYGSNVITWDLLFGTWWCPREREPSTDIGLPHGTNFPDTFWGHMTTPFVWKKIKSPYVP